MAFFDNIKFPFFTMQELNLDWLLNEVKRIAGFMPQGGNIGDILTRKSDGAAWEPPEAVNININALPEDTVITDNDQLVFYDISASANRKIKPPNLLDSMMSNGTPLMDGTASPGTSKKPARYDHKHPTDTTRAPASYFQNNALKVSNGGTGATDAQTARQNLGIVRGSVSAAISSNSVQVTHVDFTDTLPSVPQVVACISSQSSDASVLAGFSVSVRSATTTGFDVAVGVNGTTTATYLTIRWIAVA